MPTDIACPECSHGFALPAFPGNLAVLQAVRLQAQRLGVEVACENCGACFLFRATGHQQPDPSPVSLEAPPCPM